jgi:hypothetical protein
MKKPRTIRRFLGAFKRFAGSKEILRPAWLGASADPPNLSWILDKIERKIMIR